jgi:hypothetical protein
MEHLEVIKKSLSLLSDNEWVDRYAEYVECILKNPEKKLANGFRRPQGLSMYSSVSRRNGKSFDLRFAGQSVAEMTKDSDNKYTVKIRKNGTKGKYFEGFPKLHLPETFKYGDRDYKKFTKYFRDEAIKDNLKSPEHTLENCLLKEFSKKLRSEEKSLCYIQPVKLYNMYFQMPTPFKASDHNSLEYAREKGGGIDILARVKNTKTGSRLAVIEVKDEKTVNETQADAMKQAIAYATFIAKLLRSKSGQNWWNFFMAHSVEKPKLESGEVPNKKLNIDVVTAMPSGNTKEFSNQKLEIKELNVVLHCHSLYFDKEEYNNGNGRFIFTGTYPITLQK